MKTDLRDLVKTFNVDIPYPKIIVKEKNTSYSNLLHQSFSGIVSAFTICNQYRYHSTILSEDYSDITEVLNGISKETLNHLEILGELIVQLGGNPGYWITKKNKKLYWSPTFIKYYSTSEEILKEDIKIMMLSIDQYKNTITKIQDENIIAVLNKLILDQEFHLSLLENLQKKYILIK